MPVETKQISFLKYNNYANRTTHPGDTFEDIFGTYNVLTHRYANEIARIEEPKLWNPNDGITTVIVTPNGVDFSTEPDYLVVWFTVSDEIESRWFITETVRLHQGQYQCYLRRDVFSEAWNELMSATCFIKRAILPHTNSLIFNPEPITVNQIIGRELEIKDPTNCPWIVFYSSETPASRTVDPAADTYDAVYTGTPSQFEDEFDDMFYLNADGTAANSIQTTFCWKDGNDVRHYIRLNPSSTVTQSTPSHAVLMMGMPSDPAVTDSEQALSYTRNNLTPALVEYYNNAVKQPTDRTWATTSRYEYLKNTYDKKRVYFTGDQKIYEVKLVPQGWNTISYVHGSQSSAFNTVESIVKTKIIKDCTNFYNYCLTYWDDRALSFSVIGRVIRTNLTEIIDDTVTYTLPTTTKTQDCPYNIWCMPYGDLEVRYETTPDDPDTPDTDETVYTSVTCNKDLNLRTINTILRNAGSSAVYDAQILPYCPLPQSYVKVDISTGDPYIYVTDNKLTNTSTLKDASNNTVGYIFTVPYSTFERTILLAPEMTPEDYKIDSMTRTYRIYSPNYSSSFEFSLAKNDGLTGFNVKCTYLPSQPYIRVAPIWGGVYGSDEFNKDPRGLICQGDYSLARLNDAWINYVEQNKNYQSIFARQLSSMDVQRGIQKQQEQWGVAAGVLGGVTGGAVAGSAAGPWGALAGAVVGGVGAGVTGAMDLKNSEKLYQENRSYATDMYEMNLGNIQAMPVGLSRTTAFNVDNRYFPVLTVYVGTAQDYVAAINFIMQRSMNVGVYGNFSAVVNNTWSLNYNGHIYTDRGFIQGSIVNINTIHDSHFVDALNDEISKGVYTK